MIEFFSRTFSAMGTFIGMMLTRELQFIAQHLLALVIAVVLVTGAAVAGLTYGRER